MSQWDILEWFCGVPDPGLPCYARYAGLEVPRYPQVMTLLLVVEAVKRLFFPEVVDGRAMFTISVIGLGMNFVLMGVLGHNHGHGGAHGHSLTLTPPLTLTLTNPNPNLNPNPKP